MPLQLLSRLFSVRNPLASPQAEVRLDALRSLTPERAAAWQGRLAECARNDADESVRSAAIAWLEDQDLLIALLEDAAVAPIAAARLVAKGWAAEHPFVRRQRMRNAGSAEDALRVLGETSAFAQRAELYLCCPEAWRAALLRCIRRNGDAGLAALEKASRNRDKQANQAARGELERLRTLRKDVADLSSRAEELTTALGKPAAAAVSPRITHLKKELQGCCDGIQAKAETLAEYGAQIPDLTAWLAAASQAQAPCGGPPKPTLGFKALVRAFEELGDKMAAGGDFEALRAERDQLTQEWLTRADQVQPVTTQHAVFERVSHQYQELADAHQRWLNLKIGTVSPPPVGDWPKAPEALQDLWRQQREAVRNRERLQWQIAQVRWPQWAKASTPVQQAIDLVVSLERFEQQAQAHQQQLAEQLRNVIAEAEASLADGGLQGAAAALGNARRLEKSLPEALTAAQRKALSKLSAQVNELRGWQTFATTTRREQLVEAMRTLADEPLAAKEQAERIKALRKDWNALGHPANSKERTLRGKFDQVAERAFEPCRSHFAEQAELRKANQVRQQQLCDQLETYVAGVDWRKADMRAAEKILRTAREEWRAARPVDRKKGKDLEARFEQLQSQIHAAVKQAREKNLALKQELLAAAEALAAGDAAVAEKVAEVKRLQRCWRDIGITPHGADQKLWRQFRKHCDQVFAARKADRCQADQRSEDAVAAAEDICKTLEEALESASNASPKRSLASRLRGDLEALELPDRLRFPLVKRFNDLARSYDQLLLAAEWEALRRRLEQLRSWDAQVSQAEAEDRDAPVPDPIFNGRGDGDGAGDGDRKGSGGDVEAALLRLTLVAEIEAGIESPAAEAATRLQVQAAALQDRMGQRIGPKAPKEMAEDWCRIGPKTPACDPLRERFFTAVLALAQPMR